MKGVSVNKQPWRRHPTLSDEDEYVRSWMEHHLDFQSPRRRWQTQGAAINLWMYLGRQWIQAKSQLAAHNGGYHFEDVYRESTAAFPMPVTNLVAPAVDNEVSRLARKEYSPDCTAHKNKPEYIAAAKMANDILAHEMQRQEWDDKREHLIFNLCIERIAICRTWWDENDLEQTLIASPNAVKCPECGRYWASRAFPLELIEGLPGEGAPPNHVETFRDSESGPEMTHCPYCPNLSLLKPFEMNEMEAMSEDAFGGPMGHQVPRGEGQIDVLSVHEFFPENSGLGCEPHQQTVESQVTVRPLEWIALRFPEIADKIDPEDPTWLLRHNPLYADRIFQGGGLGLGSGYEAYDNHARVFETIIQPKPIEGLELGAWFIKVGDEVIRRPLCAEVEAEQGTSLVPRVKYHYARFKRMPGNFWGRSFVDDLIPLQRRLNELDAQVIDIRERGVPTVWMPEGSEIYTREDQTGALKVLHYDGVSPAWSPRDAVQNGIPLTGSVYDSERQQIIVDMQRLGAPEDIERGVGGTTKTTSGLMLLSEEASRKRAPRERAMLDLYQSVFQHYLQMQWAFRKEDATYEVQREGGVYEQESYTGTDLLGDLRVKMEARVGYDQTLYNKEAAAEALTLGLYKLDSPAAVDRILDLMKLPKDVNENQTLQLTRAEQAWSHFLRMQTVPNIDPTLHDPSTWFSVLGKRWHEDDAYIAQKRCGWDRFLPALTGWQERLQQTMAEEMVTKPIYGKIPPERWQDVFAQGTQLVQSAMGAYQNALASFQNTSAMAPEGAAPPMPPTPPPMQQFPPPPAQGFLPEPLEQKVYTIFRRMLPEFDQALLAAQTAQALSDTVAMAPEAAMALELDAWLRMRGVIEAFRLMATGQMQTAAMAPPMPGSQPAGVTPQSPGAGAPGTPPNVAPAPVQ